MTASAPSDFRLDRGGGSKTRPHPALEEFVELAQPRQRAIKYAHLRAEPDRHARRLGSDHAAAENCDTRRRHARHAAEQHAAAATVALQRGARRLDREPACHLAHRREQRQAQAIGTGDRLVSDGGTLGCHQPFRLPRIGSEVEIGEKDLVVAQLDPFGRLRLLHLHDQFAAGKDLRGTGGDLGADRAIGLVACSDTGPGAGLDFDAMPGGNEFACRVGGESDAIFVHFDFFQNADAHGRFSRLI